MKALHVKATVDTGFTVHETILPFSDVPFDIDVQILRDLSESAGGSSDFAEANSLDGKFATSGVWTQWTDGTGVSTSITEPQLIVLISGALTSDTSSQSSWRLDKPGAVLLVTLEAASALSALRFGNCRTLHIGVGQDLLDRLDGPDKPHRTLPARGEEPKLKRIDTGADRKAYFSEFSSLFTTSDGEPSPRYQSDGYWFSFFPQAAFVDFHPEVVRNLVVPLSGFLELAVRGGGRTEIHEFYPGDICLAADNVGDGHTDRVDGTMSSLIVEMTAEGLWRN